MEKTDIAGLKVLRLPQQGPLIATEADGNDVIADAFSVEADFIVIPLERLGPDFLRLETRLAGFTSSLTQGSAEAIATIDTRIAGVSETIDSRIARMTETIDGRSNFLAETVAARFMNIHDSIEARAGAGIVADSRPAAERAETETKIAALAAALASRIP